MPTYTFECSYCGFSHDIMLLMKNRRIVQRCPKCGKNMHRLIGAGGGFIFKGDGFYATDYKKEK